MDDFAAFSGLFSVSPWCITGIYGNKPRLKLAQDSPKTFGLSICAKLRFLDERLGIQIIFFSSLGILGETDGRPQ